jgi:predicted nucleic acid-binding protein
MPYDTVSTRILAHRNQSRDDLAMARQAGGFRRAPATWFAWPSPGAGARAAAALGNGTALGSCHDALVAATAAEYGITLATRDRRAAETYRALDIDFELIH